MCTLNLEKGEKYKITLLFYINYLEAKSPIRGYPFSTQKPQINPKRDPGTTIFVIEISWRILTIEHQWRRDMMTLVIHF